MAGTVPTVHPGSRQSPPISAALAFGAVGVTLVDALLTRRRGEVLAVA